MRPAPDKALSNKATDDVWSENEFGVISWHGRKEGDTWHAAGHDPFSAMLGYMNNSPNVSEAAKKGAILVRDDLDVARSIALSIFGRHWRDHVMDVYDRLQARVKEQEKLEPDLG